MITLVIVITYTYKQAQETYIVKRERQQHEQRDAIMGRKEELIISVGSEDSEFSVWLVKLSYIVK